MQDFYWSPLLAQVLSCSSEFAHLSPIIHAIQFWALEMKSSAHSPAAVQLQRCESYKVFKVSPSKSCPRATWVTNTYNLSLGKVGNGLENLVDESDSLNKVSGWRLGKSSQSDNRPELRAFRSFIAVIVPTVTFERFSIQLKVDFWIEIRDLVFSFFEIVGVFLNATEPHNNY